MLAGRRGFLKVASFVLGQGIVGARSQTSQSAATAPSTDAGAKETVTGIGGLFFRAQDPKGLAKWYEEHLGVNPVPTSYGQKSWEQQAGPTAFAPFPEKTGYFDQSKMWMVNFRVRNLDRMVAQLRTASIDVKVDETKYPNGRFAHLHDPEGNPIELWEPA